MQILVLGMHRSGTSMVTRLINMMGAYFGPENSVGEITDDNSKGFWERPEIFKLNESLLAIKAASRSDLRRIELPSEHEIRSFIDTRLHRSHPNIGELTPAHLLLCDMLQGNIDKSNPHPARPTSIRIPHDQPG